MIAELVGILKLHFAIENHQMKKITMAPESLQRHEEAHRRANERLRLYELELIEGLILPSQTILSGLINDFVIHLKEETEIFRHPEFAI